MRMNSVASYILALSIRTNIPILHGTKTEADYIFVFIYYLSK